MSCRSVLSLILTLQNNCDRIFCVSMSIHFLSLIGIELEDNFTTSFGLGLAFATGFPVLVLSGYFFGRFCDAFVDATHNAREFVLDSGASMHMIRKKDLSDVEIHTLTKSYSPTIVITANGEVQTHEEATVNVKELDTFLTMKVLENTPAVLSLGKLCDENGYSYEWINGQKPHLIRNGIRIPCNTENFVPIVVPGLSSSSSGSSSTSMTPSRQESHSSSSSSTLSSSPAVSEIQTREREDQTESNISPVHVSTTVDDRSGRPDDTQANKNQKPIRKNPRRNRVNRCVLRSRSDCKNSGKIWWMMKFQYTEILTPVLLMKCL